MPRVRTGCMTCRKRRRKCDEEKPECRNCQAKDLTCRYGVNYTFVQYSKQAGQKRRCEDPTGSSEERATSLPHQSRQTGRQPTVAKPSDDYGERFDQQHPTLHTPEQQAMEELRVVAQQTEHGSPDPEYTLLGHTEAQQTGISQPEAQPCMTHSTEAQSGVPQLNLDVQEFRTLSSTSTSNLVHSAAKSLHSMSGRASSIANDCALNVWPVLNKSQSLPNPFMEVPRRFPSYTSTSRGNSNMGNATDRQLQETSQLQMVLSPLLDNESLEFELLSHFRYAVAPQLDLSPDFSYWTVRALRQAVYNTSLRCAIFALSSQSLAYASNQDFDFHEGRSKIFAAHATLETPPTVSDDSGEPDESFAIQVLLSWKCLLENAPGQWLESLRQKELNGFYEQSHLAPYILWQRLRLSSVLVAPVACVLRSDMLFDAAQSVPSSGHAATRQLQDVMSLLLRSFSQQRNWLSELQQLPPTLSWQVLWNEAQAWFWARSGELQPIFEHCELHTMAFVESEIQVFPIVVFSNLHAILATTCFHLAAFILLQCKPRLIKVCAEPTLILSPTWHVLRILGIASVAVSGGFYDPLLIAAVIKASKMLSSNEQLIGAQEILRRVQLATGMKLHGEIRALEKLQAETSTVYFDEGV